MMGANGAVKRIEDVIALRARQFAEDAGPMKHPIRPDSYVSMDNFYTATVYVKGAEIIRMYQTLLSVQGFRKGMDLYFQRHDGSAVTCDDFLSAMADANGVDLTQFARWYSTAGTPMVKYSSTYQDGTFELTLEQSSSSTMGPLHIPVAVGVRTGKKLECYGRLEHFLVSYPTLFLAKILVVGQGFRKRSSRYKNPRLERR